MMSFPDDFALPEDQSMTAIAKQIGNAVPCLLAQRIANVLAAHLDDAGVIPAADQLQLMPPHSPAQRLSRGSR